jgi:hypothetical protein
VLVDVDSFVVVVVVGCSDVLVVGTSVVLVDVDSSVVVVVVGCSDVLVVGTSVVLVDVGSTVVVVPVVVEISLSIRVPTWPKLLISYTFVAVHAEIFIFLVIIIFSDLFTVARDVIQVRHVRIGTHGYSKNGRYASQILC